MELPQPAAQPSKPLQVPAWIAAKASPASSTPAAGGGEPLYRIRISTNEIGPYTLAGLRGLLADGVITVATPIIPADGGDWMPLGDLLPPQPPAQATRTSPPPPPGSVRQPPPPPSPSRRTTPPPPPAPMVSSVAVASPGQAMQAKQKSSPVAAGCGCLVVGFLVICLFGLIPQSPEKEAESVRFDAYYTASEFAKKQYPGIKTIAPYKEAIVEQHGNTYIVAFHVDGVNAFNAPIKRRVGVELELRGTTWHLRGIKEQ